MAPQFVNEIFTQTSKKQNKIMANFILFLWILFISLPSLTELIEFKLLIKLLSNSI